MIKEKNEKEKEQNRNSKIEDKVTEIRVLTAVAW